MKKVYSFRAYPNRKQEIKLNRTLATCRKLYNNALEKRKREAELNRLCAEFQVFPWGKPEWINYYDQANDLSSEKTPEQKEVFSQVLQDVLRRLDKSFRNFFRGAGFPRFKGRNRYNTFTYPQSGFEIDIENGKINLSKIGSINIVLHREIEGTIKTFTIKKDVDHWYVIITTEIDIQIQKVPVITKIGVDVGLKSLLALSNGELIEPPEYFRKSENKLGKEQVRLSRKKKGSNNRKKQVIRVARVHRKIKNQRKDFTRKTARNLVNQYDLIGFEDLQIQNMMYNHHLAKSIADAGWYQLQMITKYKAEEAGKQVRFCNAKGTTKTCHVCGNVQKMTLKDRIFRCNVCRNVQNRDINSANVVENRCTAGTAGIEACQSGLVGDMMKQEASLLVGR